MLCEGRAPIVAMGDEDGTVQIEYQTTESDLIFSVRKPGQPDALRRWAIDRSFDIKTVANELLADLGA